MFELLWEGYQQRSIWKAQEELQSTSLSVEFLRDQLADTLNRLDRAELVAMALWELVGEKLGITTEELRAKVNEIDLRDGVLDGRYGGEVPAACSGCSRPIHPKRTRCMYCGQPRRGSALATVMTTPTDEK